MNYLLKLGQTIENCKKHLFNEGYSYDEAQEFVKMCFADTGFSYGIFDQIPTEEIQNVIDLLNDTIINN